MAASSPYQTKRRTTNVKYLSLATVIVALALAGSAAATSFSKRTLSDGRVGTTKAELQAQHDFSLRMIRSLSGSWKIAPRHATCWSHVPWARVCDRARRTLRAHRWLLDLATRRLERLYPTGPAHLDGWRCITNGAYRGAPHEGDGYNGSFSGPLGMTTPWAGYLPPGSDWVHSDPIAVYSIAEKVAAAHHFDPTWMRGQWPQTYPPCAGHFAM